MITKRERYRHTTMKGRWLYLEPTHDMFTNYTYNSRMRATVHSETDKY